jgi:hypothetical protein
MRYLLLLLACAAAAWAALPGPTVPDGLGVNIHFTGAPARDLDAIAAAGFRFVRMDFAWEGVERVKGVYTFDAYDALVDGLQARGLRALFILDYGNRLYEPTRAVATEDGRQAFARFAAAAGAHFRGKGIIWELWNEPNLNHFWQPKPDAGAYLALAKAALPALRKADPDATIIAPATSQIDLPFLEACFKGGLLDLVDAVSVHPYRQTIPESAAAEIAKLRVRIARYSPDRPNLPVLSGEWGYSTAWKGCDDARQGHYLARMFLSNLAAGVPLSIWYDWHDDGVNPADPEHHFGTVKHDYTPKPAYAAMQRLTKALNGMHFVKRIATQPEDYQLLFTNGTAFTLAAWTTGAAHPVAPWPGAKIALTGDPQYVVVPTTAHAMLAEGAWTVTLAAPAVASSPLAKGPLPGFTVTVRNPFAKAVRVEMRVSGLEIGNTGPFVPAFTVQPGATVIRSFQSPRPARRDEDLLCSVDITVDGTRRQHVMRFPLTDYVTVRLIAMGSKQQGVYLQYPAEIDIAASLLGYQQRKKEPMSLRYSSKLEKLNASYPTQKLAVFPVAGGCFVPLPEIYNDTAFTLIENGKEIANTGQGVCTPLDVTTRTAVTVNDGDLKVPATFTLEEVAADQDAPVTAALRFTYDYAQGWKFVRLAPPKPLPVAGTPHAIGVWVKGNTTHNTLVARFADATGRVYQPRFGNLDFTGWRFLTAPLDDPTAYHWGGSTDVPGITYPISINTFILVDGNRAAAKDVVEFAGFQLLY